MSSHHDHVVKEAYYLWERAGRPHGRDIEFWAEAERIVSAITKNIEGKTGIKTEEKAPEKPKKEKSAATPKPKSAAKAPAKPRKKAVKDKP